MSKTYYTKDHEWISVDGDIGAIGITDFAQQQLGDVVFVELPEAGAALEKGAEAAVVESVKAASEVYMPVGGEVTEVNDALADEPSLVNTDPTGSGWFLKIRIAQPGDLEALMDESAYNTYVEGLD